MMIDLVPATRRTAEVIANLGDEQLSSPTPCPRYSVGDLLDHVEGLTQAFTDAASKDLGPGNAQGPSGDAARLEPGWRTRIPARLAALAEAWSDPAAWEGVTQAGGVDMPGQVAGIVALDEVIVHGWDIARASGQAFDAEPEHVEVCIQMMQPQPGEERPLGDDVMFGRPVATPDDARPIDRLVAILGRDPSWAAPSR
jgi:uncharacterized protein (TIGR03086 family)